MIDRSTWRNGPWQNEPDRDEWYELDFPCLAVRTPLGHWCGYVAVPPGHPVYGETPDLSVHGGITYAKLCAGNVCHTPREGEPDNVWWLGFDCAHCSDYSPGMPYSFGREGYRTLTYVKAECASLAQQLKELTP